MKLIKIMLNGWSREGYYIWEDQRCPTGGEKGTNGGLALCFSACDDDQTSLSTSVIIFTLIL